MEELTRDLILEAIKKINDNPDLRNGRESTTYDLVHEGNNYPPILVLSEANKIAGGEELTLSRSFSNNTDQAFSFLRGLGFEVVEKTFLNQLHKFFKRVKEEGLNHADFVNNYKDVSVRVSFGAGNLARIPWIAFLREGQRVSDGIYPVYLFYKEHNLLILAYGVSETNSPVQSWDLSNPIKIREYFEGNGLGVPDRYGESYVYKAYNMAEREIDASFNDDLDEIIEEYKNVSFEREGVLNQEFEIKSFEESLRLASLFYENSVLVRLLSSLASKPFLILTGLSGSGKTKLAQAFVEWICEDKNQINLVPVGADWTNREPLFGYPNALEQKSYVLPETGALQLILRAIDDSESPYFLILDEMNLSHVERYFADFLSAIESKEEIKLHSGKGELWDGVPCSITIPKNLFIIGTVNIDETTYMFSPKVLDRANVIEFRVSQEEMSTFLENPADIDLSQLRGKGASMAGNFVEIATSATIDYSGKDKLSKELLKFFNELMKVGAEFGYRTANEVSRFASLAEKLAQDWGFDDIMDAAIAQKLLPKLHGSRRKLEKVLFKLGDLCLPETENGCEDLFRKHEFITPEVIIKARYPISCEKIVRMHKGLMENGFTSFAEA